MYYDGPKQNSVENLKFKEMYEILVIVCSQCCPIIDTESVLCIRNVSQILVFVISGGNVFSL